MKKIILPIFAILVSILSCNSNEKQQKESQKKYEEVTLSIEDLEKKSPINFLKVSGADKKNLMGQTVVKGKISNKAKMVTFKDIDIQLSFYSKTGVLLMEDQEMIYEDVAPGSNINFKSKYFAPKGTDSVAMKVLSAKY
ncbi:MAG: hypothetical protein WD135_07610 [Ferruginibacter sp.]